MKGDADVHTVIGHSFNKMCTVIMGELLLNQSLTIIKALTDITQAAAEVNPEALINSKYLADIFMLM
jgi:hypothetical protein